jgi:hypothetical protein
MPRTGVAHRREIDDGRHAGEVLEENARRHERDLLRRRPRGIPVEHRLDVRGGSPDVRPSRRRRFSRRIFSENGQPCRAVSERAEAMDTEASAADAERVASVEAVCTGRHRAKIYACGSAWNCLATVAEFR